MFQQKWKSRNMRQTTLHRILSLCINVCLRPWQNEASLFRPYRCNETVLSCQQRPSLTPYLIFVCLLLLFSYGIMIKSLKLLVTSGKVRSDLFVKAAKMLKKAKSKNMRQTILQRIQSLHKCLPATVTEWSKSFESRALHKNRSFPLADVFLNAFLTIYISCFSVLTNW